MSDYRPSNLVLAVAEAMHEADGYYVSYDQARAAVNFVLEEAALVADSAAIPMCETSADFIAAAIRALKE